MTARLLIVDDDQDFSGALQRALKANFSVSVVANEPEALEAFAAGPRWARPTDAPVSISRA